MTDIGNPWRYAARSAFLGYTTYAGTLIALVVLFRKGFKRFAFAAIVLVFLAMLTATGHYLDIGTFRFRTLTGWLNVWIPSTVLLRHLFRSYHYAAFGMILMIAMAVNILVRREKPVLFGATVLFAILFLLENVSFRAPTYPSREYLAPPQAMYEGMQLIADSSNVYVLPSCERASHESAFSETFNPFTREFMYGNWKLHFPVNLFNGRVAYLPQEAYENNLILCDMTHSGYDILLERNSIDYFLVLKDIADDNYWERIDPILREQALLIAESSSWAVFSP